MAADGPLNRFTGTCSCQPRSHCVLLSRRLSLLIGEVPMERSERLPSAIRPTIQDVARLAGVSAGTVSHALTKSRFVRPETVERVKTAIAKLGYRPNRVAQSLIKRQTHTVGMVLPNLINPSHVDLLHAVEETLSDEGYVVVFGNSQNDPVKEHCCIAAFRDRRVDGLITAIATDADVAEMRALAEEMPVVMVNRIVPGCDGDSVLCDTQIGMELAIDHLVGLGHRQIAFINGDPRIQTARMRRAGLDAALRKHGLVAAAISDGVFSVESGHAQVLDLIRSGIRASAICAGNDLMAFGVLEGIKEAGLRVPEDVSVVGFNDISYARFTSPSLTTVNVPYRLMGAEAARIILDRLANRKAPPQQIIVKPRLVVRYSTAPVQSTSATADHEPTAHGGGNR